MFVIDPCETLNGLARWILFEIAISISVSGASECPSCAYQAHNDFTNFSVFIMHCYFCIDLP
jgi:hypothetical protein